MKDKLILVLGILVILSAVNTGIAWNWETLKCPEGNCSISMPPVTDKDTNEVTHDSDSYNQYMYFSTMPDFLMSLCIYDLTHWENENISIPDGQAYLYRFLKPQKDRLKKPQTLYIKDIVLDNTYPGLEFKLSGKKFLGKEFVTCRLYLVRKKIYYMVYVRDKGSSAHKNDHVYTTRFFDSFRLLENE